jgi:hypothetical protein
MLGCMQDYFIAWWNLENLFDAEDSPNRRPRLREILKEELQGWNEEILRAKIDQLSKIIVRINNNDGPDILGVCEVEDGPVINKLVDRITELLPRDYKIVHEKYDDKRGIEVAFIYDAAKFEVGKNNHTGEEQIFSHHVLRSEATRNILQVNFRLKTSDNTRLILIGNHWPARTIGELETECFRIAAGDALSYFHKRILEEHGKDTSIIAMGDFNDQPFNRSIMDHALSTPYEGQVKNAHENSPFFYNLMWHPMTNGEASYYYTRKDPGPCSKTCTTFPNMLDQFMVSRSVKFGNKLNVKEGSVRIIKEEGMYDNEHEFPIPKKFGRPTSCGQPASDFNMEGFSDHFPISLVLQEM